MSKIASRTGYTVTDIYSWKRFIKQKCFVQVSVTLLVAFCCWELSGVMFAMKRMVHFKVQNKLIIVQSNISMHHYECLTLLEGHSHQKE